MKAQSLGSLWAGMSVAVPCDIAILSGPSSSVDPPKAMSDGLLHPSPRPIRPGVESQAERRLICRRRGGLGSLSPGHLQAARPSREKLHSKEGDDS
ncbi:hypothetical protein LY76DRAFT_225964 [Colletotrichum caudatum]|nr:hypothetical protein LY76DRAFT_225964 [Colletotrichum caudatum]